MITHTQLIEARCRIYASVYWVIIGSHYNDVIMGAMASQITSLTIVYSTVYSGADQRTHESSVSLAFVGNSPVTGEFPAQMASNAENASIWWRHHGTLIVLCFGGSLTAYSAQSHHYNQCWFDVNWILRNQLHWHLNQSANISFNIIVRWMHYAQCCIWTGSIFCL